MFNMDAWVHEDMTPPINENKCIMHYSEHNLVVSKSNDDFSIKLWQKNSQLLSF